MSNAGRSNPAARIAASISAAIARSDRPSRTSAAHLPAPPPRAGGPASRRAAISAASLIMRELSTIRSVGIKTRCARREDCRIGGGPCASAADKPVEAAYRQPGGFDPHTRRFEPAQRGDDRLVIAALGNLELDGAGRPGANQLARRSSHNGNRQSARIARRHDSRARRGRKPGQVSKVRQVGDEKCVEPGRAERFPDAGDACSKGDG